MTKQNFIDVVIDYTANGNDGNLVKKLTDEQREIVAIASRDTVDVALEDMEEALDVYYEDYSEIMDMKADYADDERVISLADLEKALCERYGWSEYDKEAGCHTHEGGWFSIDDVLKTVAESDYLCN